MDAIDVRDTSEQILAIPFDITSMLCLFGSWVYPMGSLVIALVPGPSVRGLSVGPSLIILKTAQ